MRLPFPAPTGSLSSWKKGWKKRTWNLENLEQGLPPELDPRLRISLTARVSEAYFVFFKTHILGWRSLLVNAGAEMTSEHHLLKLFSQSTFNLGFQNNKVLCLMISPFFLIALITPKAKSKLHHILTYKWKSSAVSFFISWREVHKFDNFHLPKVHIFHDGIFLTSTNNINNELLLLLSFLNPLRGT